MPRQLSTGFRNSVEATRDPEMTIVFVTITHPSVVDPIRVVSDKVDYLREELSVDGEVITARYFGVQFAIELLGDGESPPRGRLTVQNVDQKVSAAIEGMRDSPRLRVDALPLSKFGDVEIVDGRLTRRPLSPIVESDYEYSAAHLSLRNIKGDTIAVSADFAVYDVTVEPWPGIRTTQNRLPGLYR